MNDLALVDQLATCVCAEDGHCARYDRPMYGRMRQICQGRTVLIIAHRLSTVRQADRIITIERGQVVEDGTHTDLLRQGGRYAALYRVQAGETVHEAI